jgi:hypothetical protein
MHCPRERFRRRDELERAFGFGRYAGTKVVLRTTGFTIVNGEGADCITVGPGRHRPPGVATLTHHEERLRYMRTIAQSTSVRAALGAALDAGRWEYECALCVLGAIMERRIFALEARMGRRATWTFLRRCGGRV